MTLASSQGSISAENKMQVSSFAYTPISNEENKPRAVESNKRKAEGDEKLVDFKRPKIIEPLGKTCPLLCGFTAATKNHYRHMQDHLTNVHFTDELAPGLPNLEPKSRASSSLKCTGPYECPMSECNGRIFNNHQDLKRHYIGNQH